MQSDNPLYNVGIIEDDVLERFLKMNHIFTTLMFVMLVLSLYSCSRIDSIFVDTPEEEYYDTKIVYLIPIYGQSLAIVGEADRITSYCRYPNTCGNTTSLNLIFTGNEDSSYGLIESFAENYEKCHSVSAVNHNYLVVSFATGDGATSIVELGKGSNNYGELLSLIKIAYENATSHEMELIVPAFCWVQGEHDRYGAYTSDYRGDLVQLRVDLDSDIKAITQQTRDVHCIVYQTNQLSLANFNVSTPFMPNNYESGKNGALIIVPQAQYELIRDDQYFHASTPIYPMSYVTSPNGMMIHIDGPSQKLLGYYEGLAAERIVDGDSMGIGLYVTKVIKLDRRHIVLKLHVPSPPLVIDTVAVKEVDHYGFSVITSNNKNIISSVEISQNPNSTQSIHIKTSSDCTGAKLRYGVNGTNGVSGHKDGSRGNIRDSQGISQKATINGEQVEMHNWLYFFEETL